jgi:hypothetical protein
MTVVNFVITLVLLSGVFAAIYKTWQVIRERNTQFSSPSGA